MELLVLVLTSVGVEAVEELQEVVFLLVLDRVRYAADGLKLLHRFCFVEISVKEGFHILEERLVQPLRVKAALFEGKDNNELLVQRVVLKVLFIERDENLEGLQQGTSVEKRLEIRLARLDGGDEVPLRGVFPEAVRLGMLTAVESHVAHLHEHFGEASQRASFVELEAVLLDAVDYLAEELVEELDLTLVGLLCKFAVAHLVAQFLR